MKSCRHQICRVDFFFLSRELESRYSRVKSSSNPYRWCILRIRKFKRHTFDNDNFHIMKSLVHDASSDGHLSGHCNLHRYWKRGQQLHQHSSLGNPGIPFFRISGNRRLKEHFSWDALHPVSFLLTFRYSWADTVKKYSTVPLDCNPVNASLGNKFAINELRTCYPMKHKSEGVPSLQGYFRFHNTLPQKCYCWVYLKSFRVWLFRFRIALYLIGDSLSIGSKAVRSEYVWKSKRCMFWIVKLDSLHNVSYIVNRGSAWRWYIFFSLPFFAFNLLGRQMNGYIAAPFLARSLFLRGRASLLKLFMAGQLRLE